MFFKLGQFVLDKFECFKCREMWKKVDYLLQFKNGIKRLVIYVEMKVLNYWIN